MNPKIGDTWDWTLDTILGAFSDLNFNDIVMQLCEYTNIFVRPSSWQTSLSVHGMNGMNWNEHLSKRLRNDPEQPGIRSNWYWLYSSDLIDTWSSRKSYLLEFYKCAGECLRFWRQIGTSGDWRFIAVLSTELLWLLLQCVRMSNR